MRLTGQNNSIIRDLSSDRIQIINKMIIVTNGLIYLNERNYDESGSHLDFKIKDS